MNKYIFLVLLIIKFIDAQQQTECQRRHLTHVYGSCAKFYLCSQNVTLTIISCPRLYNFDSNLKRCQLESRVTCPCWRACLNGGICVKGNNSTESCICRVGNYGEYCEFSTNSFNSTTRSYLNSTTGNFYNPTTGSFYNSTTRSFYNSTTGNFYNSTTGSFYNSTTRSYYNSTTGSFYNSTTASYCRNTTCLNGGSCFSFNSVESCICQSGFYGRNCELFQSTTLAFSTNSTTRSFYNSTTGSFYNSTTRSSFNSTTSSCRNTACLNGGACVGDYCICTSGYAGIRCEEYIK